MPITFEPVPEWLQDELIDHVGRELLRLHITPSMDGFRYHSTAIAQTVQNPDRVRYITKELYPDIARRHGTTPSRVERAMRTAIMRCWSTGGRETLDEMAGYHLTERPTNSVFISIVAAHIRHRS